MISRSFLLPKIWLSSCVTMILSFGTNADVSESICRSIQHLFYESYNKQRPVLVKFNSIDQLTNPRRGDNIAQRNQSNSKGEIWLKPLMYMPTNFSSTLVHLGAHLIFKSLEQIRWLQVLRRQSNVLPLFG